MSLPAGSTLGFRYAMEQQIGAGGFSEVWRAHDAVLDRPVAIKLLHTEHARHAQTLARFRTEAQLAGRLSHQNVARVYDFCDSDQAGPPYLVMELIDGPSLADVLAAGPLDPARTMGIIAQAATGLQAAHAAGLVHRDIKPANIMLTSGGAVKITDFGLSHTLAAAPITGTGMLIGTPGYLAPERAGGARATPASDLYSLGVLGYECLVGNPPFAGTPLEVALAHRDRPFPPLPAATPAAVAGFIAELTAKEPADRPADASVVARRAAQLRDQLASWPAAGELGSAVPISTTRAFASEIAAAEGRLARAGDPATLVTPGPPPSSRTSARPRRHRAGAVIAVVTLAAAGLAAVLVALNGGSGAGQPSAASGRQQRTQVAGAVDVRRAALIGEPVRVAAQQLRSAGLLVRVVWLRTDAQQPGRVVTVRPAGVRSPGSVVTLVVARPHGDNGNGHGKNGDGQGSQND